MADWSRIQHQVDALISTSVAAARSDQSLWSWRENLRRLIQDFRETGTPRVSAYSLYTAEADIESNAVRLFGLVIDNSQAAIDAFVVTYNTNSPTLGTTNPLGVFWAPANRVSVYSFRPIVYSAALSWASLVGTQVGLEDGTGSAASTVSSAFVYSE